MFTLFFTFGGIVEAINWFEWSVHNQIQIRLQRKSEAERWLFSFWTAKPEVAQMTNRPLDTVIFKPLGPYPDVARTK